jgi:hypothetical protein
MIRLIAAAGLVLLVATSANAMTPAPIAQTNEMTTQVAFGCGPFRTRIGGVCVSRARVRHARRVVRRCVRWYGGRCRVWRY